MSDSLLSKNVWSAEIVFTAPGEFPQRLLRAIEVHAATIEAALTRAAERGQTMGLDSKVVKIERKSPSWKNVNA